MNAPFDPEKELLSAIDNRIRMLKAELSCATSGERQRIIENLEACKSLRQKMVYNWKKHPDEPSYQPRTLH
jgi:hypothetical protein